MKKICKTKKATPEREIVKEKEKNYPKKIQLPE